MFLPYNTDAPIYHWPISTVAVIAVNVVVLITVGGYEGVAEQGWILYWGNGIHPAQWITSVFAHADLFHLAGNMLFLWVFGMLVEGKIGWWRFLLVYLGIGAIQCAIEQVVMLGYVPDPGTFFVGESPGSLGASSAIFGLVAMAWLWAPKNDVSCLLLIGVRAVNFEMSIQAFAIYIIGWDILMALLMCFAMSTPVLHLMGAGIGMGLAYAFLKADWVECEGWDFFSLRKGKGGAASAVRATAAPAADPPPAQTSSGQLQRITAHVESGQFAAAARIYSEVAGAAVLPFEQLVALVKGLEAEKATLLAMPLMEEMIERFPDRSKRTRLRLAQIYLTHTSEPEKAIDVLSGLEPDALSEDLEKIRAALTARADEMKR